MANESVQQLRLNFSKNCTMGTGININRLMVSRNLKKRREATERAMKMEIKTCFDIDMSKGNWSFPCCAGIKKYVVREKGDLKDFKI